MRIFAIANREKCRREATTELRRLWNKEGTGKEKVLRYTKHGRKRLQQRAIPDLAVKVIRRYGKRRYHKGAEVYCIDRKARDRLEEYLQTYMSKREYRKIVKYLECYIVVSNGDVITAAHRNIRLKFN